MDSVIPALLSGLDNEASSERVRRAALCCAEMCCALLPATHLLEAANQLPTHLPTPSKQALEGLRVVLGVRPQLLSVMVPRLIKPPITSPSLRALGALAEVAGAAIHPHLGALMPPLLTLASKHPDVSPQAAAAHKAVAAVSLAVQEEGLYLLMQELQRSLEEPARRRGAATAVTLFCKTSKLDYQEHVPTLITVRALITPLAALLHCMPPPRAHSA